MICEGKHARPVHLNRGRNGHAWICLACGKVGGAKMGLTDEEREALREFIEILEMNETKTAREGNNERKEKMENLMDITIRVPSNADNSSIAAALRMRAGLFEGMPAKEAASRQNTDAAPVAAKPAAAAKTAKGKTAKAPVQEEAFDLGGEETVDEDPLGIGEDDAAEEVTVTVTLDEVRAAFKAYATSKDPKKGRDNAAKLLAKNFKIKSLTELKPEDFAKALELVGG